MYQRRSFSSYNPHQNRGRRFGGRRQAPKTNKIDVNRFVRKAVEQHEPVKVVITHHFSDFNIANQLKSNILRHGYELPTPIQDLAIPRVLEGKDVLGIANTGTGKTAAFILPLINKVFLNRSEHILIIAPTRELAMQIRDEFRAFAQGMGIFATLCIGGASMFNQKNELRRRPHFVIGTPGRIKDLVSRGDLYLGNFGTIVLDEVDRMLDMGFIADIKHLIALLPEKRQSLFFSATISPEISTLINSFLKDYVTCSVKSQETSANVDQDIVKIIDPTKKVDQLHELLQDDEFKKVLIFGRTKMGVERLSNMLFKRGHMVSSIHGDKPQFKRQQAIRQFKENHIKILVATDVAARGLDIADITHVINYDVPATYEDYVHRIGRTGRGNKKGKALTFVE